MQNLNFFFVRTLLTTDFAELTFLFMISFLFSPPSTRLPPSKVNGALILTIGYLILCALDPVKERTDVKHTWWFGIPENYVGGLSLLLSVTLNSAIHGMRKSILSEGMEGRVFQTLLHGFGAVYLLLPFLYSLFFESQILFSTAHVLSFSFLFTLSLILLSLILEQKMEMAIYKNLRISLIALVRIGSSAHKIRYPIVRISAPFTFDGGRRVEGGEKRKEIIKRNVNSSSDWLSCSPLMSSCPLSLMDSTLSSSSSTASDISFVFGDERSDCVYGDD